MTPATPSTAADAPLAGPRGWSVRSVLAPRPFSRAVFYGVAAELAIAVLDVALSGAIAVAALLVLPPLVVGLTGRWGNTAIVSVLALGIATLSDLWIDDRGAGAVLVPLLVVLVGGAVALAVALVRTGTAVALRRFRLLVASADAAEVSVTPGELVDALLDALVPAFADACAIDAVVGTEQRRLGARAVPGAGDVPLPAALDDDSLARAIVLPLRARGRSFGGLCCSLGPSGRRYSQADLRFGEVLAGRVALAFDNAGLTSELSAAEEQLGAVVSSLAEAVTVTDATGQIVYANEAAVKLLCVSSLEYLLTAEPEDIMSRFAVYDEAGRPVGLEALPGYRVLAGAREAEPLLVRNVVRATGEQRWLLNKVSSLHDADGRLTRVVNVIEDVTEVKRAERAQRLLADASEALSASLDYADTLQRFAEVAVPAFADWAAVDVPGSGGLVEQVAVAHVDPTRLALARLLRELYPVHASERTGLAAVLRDGRSELQPTIPDAALVAFAQDDDHLGLLREVGFASLMIVPLQAGSQTLGALTFVNSDALRPFGEAELELARELGRRAGVAVLNARTYGRRTAIAQALQHGLLPPDLPDVPGWSSAVLYRPAGEMNEVGGDFYDVFRGPDGWLLVIGDVAGQGAEAATRTSLARFTVRTAAELTGDVSLALERLNTTLRGQAGLPLCTVVCASFAEPGDGTARLTLACAGHPPPLLVRCREVIPIGEPGTIAGAFDGEAWPAATVELVPGDVLVFYTDGVLDAVGENDRFGEERLQATVRELEGSVEERLAGLHAALEAFQRGPQSDDTTVLVLEYRGDAAPAAGAAGGGQEISR